MKNSQKYYTLNEKLSVADNLQNALKQALPKETTLEQMSGKFCINNNTFTIQGVNFEASTVVGRYIASSVEYFRYVYIETVIPSSDYSRTKYKHKTTKINEGRISLNSIRKRFQELYLLHQSAQDELEQKKKIEAEKNNRLSSIRERSGLPGDAFLSEYVKNKENEAYTYSISLYLRPLSENEISFLAPAINKLVETFKKIPKNKA